MYKPEIVANDVHVVELKKQENNLYFAKFLINVAPEKIRDLLSIKDLLCKQLGDGTKIQVQNQQGRIYLLTT